MKLIIKKSDLIKEPCSAYNDLPFEFDAIEEIKKRGSQYQHLSWLIVNCKLAQTHEMLQYYKSLNPTYADVSYLIRNCEFAQIPEMLEYYKSLNPDYRDVRWLIEYCKFAAENKHILLNE